MTGRLTRRGELLACATVAAALVVFRSLVPLLFERFDFDSDQAIVGLMAKHLSELRAFPLFFYGQHYMLGVQSWIAVPFFWVGGPSLVMLRLPLVIIGVAVAISFISVLVRQGMKPMFALVATLPLVSTTPIVSAALVETLGASVEPFAYVLLLWFVRRRPVLFGALFCVAFLHREFTMFAATSIALVQLRERSWSTSAAVRAAAAFAGVWVLIDVLKRTVNVYGPAGVPYEGASLILQARQLFGWLSFDSRPYLARLLQLITQGLPDVFGARHHLIRAFGPVSTLGAGSIAAGAAFGGALLLCGWRLGLRRRDEAGRRSSFAPYIALVGLQAVLAYGLNSGINPESPVIVRYVLFALLIPVAVFAAFFEREADRRYHAAVVALVVLWSALTFVDNARLLREYVVSPPENNYAELADYLVAHRIRYGRATYWDSYITTFLSRERAIIASTDKVRIAAYQSRVDANTSNAVVLRRQPCSGGRAVASWCIDDPLGR